MEPTLSSSIPLKGSRNQQEGRKPALGLSYNAKFIDFTSATSGLGSKIGFDTSHQWPAETLRKWNKPIAMTTEVKSQWRGEILVGLGFYMELERSARAVYDPGHHHPTPRIGGGKS